MKQKTKPKKPKSFDRSTRRYCGHYDCDLFVMFTDVGWHHIGTYGKKIDHHPLPGEFPKDGE